MPENTVPQNNIKVDGCNNNLSGFNQGGVQQNAAYSNVTLPEKYTCFEAGMTAQHAAPYVVTLPKKYTLHSFCPLFYDFSKTVGSSFDSMDNISIMEAIGN